MHEAFVKLVTFDSKDEKFKHLYKADKKEKIKEWYERRIDVLFELRVKLKNTKKKYEKEKIDSNRIKMKEAQRVYNLAIKKAKYEWNIDVSKRLVTLYSQGESREYFKLIKSIYTRIFKREIQENLPMKDKNGVIHYKKV